VILPHFITETVNAKHYQQFIRQLISLLEVKEQDYGFQQVQQQLMPQTQQ
jgi:hypothetical protein